MVVSALEPEGRPGEPTCPDAPRHGRPRSAAERHPSPELSEGGHEGACRGEFKAGYGIRASRTEKPHRRPPVCGEEMPSLRLV